MINDFVIFGSPSSKDYDVMLFVDSIGNKEESHQLVTKIESELYPLFLKLNMSYKKINPNLAIINDGVIIKVFKGTSDEVNNSLYHTYEYHKQWIPNPITRLLQRDVQLKVIRSERAILSFFTRLENRTVIKDALRNNIIVKNNILREIDFSKYANETMFKKETAVDVWKTIAFQFGQTHLLMNDIEVYSKEDIMKLLPVLESFLKRESIDLDILTRYKNDFCDKVDQFIPKMTELFEY